MNSIDKDNSGFKFGISGTLTYPDKDEYGNDIKWATFTHVEPYIYDAGYDSSSGNRIPEYFNIDFVELNFPTAIFSFGVRILAGNAVLYDKYYDVSSYEDEHVYQRMTLDGDILAKQCVLNLFKDATFEYGNLEDILWYHDEFYGEELSIEFLYRIYSIDNRNGESGFRLHGTMTEWRENSDSEFDIPIEGSNSGSYVDLWTDYWNEFKLYYDDENELGLVNEDIG